MKLFSKNSLLLSSFFGGPVAITYILWKNFKALDKQTYAQNTLYIGIASTVVLFGLLVFLPEETVDNFPNFLIPAITVGLALYLFDKYLKADIEPLIADGQASFYSFWLALGIGILSAIIVLGSVFLVYNSIPLSEAEKLYEEKMKVFDKNEMESLQFYSNLSEFSDFQLVRELENVAIPAWEENIEIIKRLEQNGELPQRLKKQVEILLEYSKLRLETFQLFKKDILDVANDHLVEIDRLHLEIEKSLNKLKSI